MHLPYKYACAITNKKKWREGDLDFGGRLPNCTFIGKTLLAQQLKSYIEELILKLFKESDKCDWEDIFIDNNAFPEFNDNYSFSQYLDPNLLGTTDANYIVIDNKEDSMDCEVR